MMIEFFKHFEWKMLGRDHVETKTPCQDSVTFASHHGVQVLAVADGAGSKSHSQHGSKIAVEKITELLSQNFKTVLQRMEESGKKKSQFDNDQAYLKDWFQTTIINEMQTFASSNQISIQDMACTLLFVVFNQDYYVAGHIGDGLIVSIHGVSGQEYTKLVSEPDGEANETFFITMAKAQARLRLKIGRMDEIKGFLITTDGIQDRVYQKKFGLSTNNLNTLVQAYYGKTNLEYKEFVDKLIANKWTDLTDDLSLALIIKEHQVIQPTIQNYLLDVLSNIKSKEQITTLSPYAYFLDGSAHFDELDFMSTETLIERLKNGL
jgi:serine/threonine protein phosphatase PrpC